MNLLKKLFRRTPKRARPYCAAIIAAAGNSTRYGEENKLLQELDGIPVLARTLLAVDRAASIDEIVIAARDGIVESTPERSTLFAVQTPQVFDAELLKAALQDALRANAALTDDCSAVEHFGKEVHLTAGDRENIKITTPLDLAVAEVILQRRGE